MNAAGKLFRKEVQYVDESELTRDRNIGGILLGGPVATPHIVTTVAIRWRPHPMEKQISPSGHPIGYVGVSFLALTNGA